MKHLKYVLLLCASGTYALASDMKTVAITNKSPLQLFVMPNMTLSSLNTISADRPMAAVLPPNSMGAQFSYPKQLWGIYILTPSAIASFKKDNPNAPLDTKGLFGWIVSKQKQAKDGVYTSTPSTSVIVSDGGNGQLAISTQ